jgi:PPK2 family polyphosphate:nucleotide phosphotransferase
MKKIHSIQLNNISTRPPEDWKEKATKKKTKELAKRLGELHNLLLANESHSILVIFQGMDASGKDGAVKNVFRYCTHNNFGVYSFKKPTDEEFGHDFLWRVHKRCPAKGSIQIFNRSHYEDILIQRVHNWIDEKTAGKRMDAINAFEQLLSFDGNTLIFKFYLHISHEQQEIELQQRIDEHDKHYKHNPGDWEEREHWEDYMRCYEDAINGSQIPWTIVPVDERWYRDYIVAKTIVDKLESLNLAYPPLETE